MRRAILATAALPLVISAAAAQSPSPTREARALWKSVIGNVNQAADELSDSMYAYRATPDVRSFGELFAHIAGSQTMYCAMALGEKVPTEDDVEKSAKTKTAIVAWTARGATDASALRVHGWARSVAPARRSDGRCSDETSHLIARSPRASLGHLQPA